MKFDYLARFLKSPQTRKSAQSFRSRRAARQQQAAVSWALEQLESRTLLSTTTLTPAPMTASTSSGIFQPVVQASITTDKLDYAPGETVKITGKGFLSTEYVQLEIDRNDGSPSTGPEHDPWIVRAGDLGGFKSTWLVLQSELDHSLQLTATGLTSGRVATTTFTDAIHLSGVSVGAQSGTLTPGTAGSATYAISTTYTGSGSSVTAALTISGLPSGASGAFSPASVSSNTPNSTLTITTTNAAAAGVYTFTVTATSGADVFSNNGTLTIGATTTTVSSSLTPTTYGQSVTFTATVTGGAGPATGTVTFKDGAATLGTGTLNGSGQATFATTALTAAAHTITAVYGGDGGHATSTSAGITQTVNKAALTVTADPASRLYGDANPTFTASYSGFKNGQTLGTSGVTGSPSLTTTATATTAVGTATITAATGTLAASNYSFTFANGTLTINKAALTVTADPTSRLYGDANPTFTASYSGFKNGEKLGSSGVSGSPSLTTTATATTAVGTATITAANGTLAASNYSFTFANGTLTINKAALTVTADPASRLYGDANPTFTASYSGFKNGENLGSSGVSGSPSLTTTATATTNVGTATITAAAGTLASGNYSFTFANGTLTISKAALTVTANPASRIYGDANPSFTASYSGFKNGQTLGTSGVTGAPSLTTTATAATNVGAATITAAAGTLASGNYSFTFANGTLTVTAAALTVTTNNASRGYGDANPSFSGSISGIKNSDNITATRSTTATAASDVGSYAITAALNDPGSKLGNYTVTNTPGSLTVTAAALTVTANNDSREYGDANPTLTGSITGIKNGDNITASYSTTATAASNVGGYAITATLNDPDSKLGNYTITNNSGTLTITAAALTVTTNNASRGYGDANPSFTGSISGIKNSDNITATRSTTATAASDVGSYAITAALNDPGSKLGNYTVTNTPGSLTVTAAALTVTANNDSREYGDANPTLTGSITGIKNGDNITASYSTTATAASNVGGYAITATLADPDSKLGNYTVSNTPGTLTVTAASLNVSVDDASREYGDSNPTFTGTLTGVKNGDNITASYSSTAGANSNVGSYAITASLGDPDSKLGNYTVVNTSGTLNVTKALLTVTANNATRQQGQANPAFTASYSGFKNGQTLGTSDVTGSPSLTTTADGSSTPGAYAITAAQGSLGSGNYDFSFVNGVLNVTDRSPVFSSFSVNNGAAQRSMVKTLSVTFDDTVTIDSGAFTLTLHGTNTTVAATVNASVSGGVVTLTFSGAGVIGGSIGDGVFDLHVDGSKVHHGTADLGINQVLAFHRLFGDINGDRTVNSVDQTAFTASFGKNNGNPAYNNAFDFDNNNAVNNTDNGQFRLRIGTTYAAY